MTAIDRLKEIALNNAHLKYPNMPKYALVIHKYNDNNANGLTRCIKDYINLIGGQAERISNTGRQIDKRETFKDVLGFSRTVGNYEFVYGTGTNGTADLSAIIGGKSVKIEIKIGKDRMSEAQIKYKSTIENAGGIYYVAKDFSSFYNWINTTFESYGK